MNKSVSDIIATIELFLLGQIILSFILHIPKSNLFLCLSNKSKKLKKKFLICTKQRMLKWNARKKFCSWNFWFLAFGSWLLAMVMVRSESLLHWNTSERIPFKSNSDSESDSNSDSKKKPVSFFWGRVSKCTLYKLFFLRTPQGNDQLVKFSN